MIAKARTNPLNLCAMPNTLECSDKAELDLIRHLLCHCRHFTRHLICHSVLSH